MMGTYPAMELPMHQPHFLLSAAARTLSLREVFAPSDGQGFALLRKVRWGESVQVVCPSCIKRHRAVFVEAALADLKPSGQVQRVAAGIGPAGTRRPSRRGAAGGPGVRSGTRAVDWPYWWPRPPGNLERPAVAELLESITGTLELDPTAGGRAGGTTPRGLFAQGYPHPAGLSRRDGIRIRSMRVVLLEPVPGPWGGAGSTGDGALAVLAMKAK
jgi:hypothetical protein